MRYRKKPIIVDAFRMTEERGKSESEWPSWLKEAYARLPTEPGTVWLAPIAFSSTKRFRVCLKNRHVHIVEWGDWIIRKSRSDLYVLTDRDFKDDYTQA